MSINEEIWSTSATHLPYDCTSPKHHLVIKMRACKLSKKSNNMRNKLLNNNICHTTTSATKEGIEVMQNMHMQLFHCFTTIYATLQHVLSLMLYC